MTRVDDVLDAIDERAPFRTAATWDAVGLQIGDRTRNVSAVAVVHEITGPVAQAILAQRFDLVVTYHPLIFRPLPSVTAAPGPEGRSLALASADVSVIAVHTNWDVADGGTSDALAEALLVDSPEKFCPTEAYSGDTVRVGRHGLFSGDTSRFIRVARRELHTRLRFAGLRDLRSPRIAVLPGSGGSHVDEAAGVCADIYLTGDISHHEARKALDRGMAIVDAGHGPSERPGVRSLYSYVEKIVDGRVGHVAIDDDPWEVEWKG